MSLSGSSIESARLTVILNDLHRLKTMLTILDGCDVAADRARKNGAAGNFTGAMLLSHITQLIDSARPRARDVEQVVSDSGLSDMQYRINLLQDIHDLVSQVPSKVFARDDGLARLKDVCQQALDDAIMEEEEAEVE